MFPIGLCPFGTIRQWEYFDSDIGKDSAREIREFHIPDFSNWKDHDSYKLAFGRLLRDLQGGSKPVPIDPAVRHSLSPSRTIQAAPRPSIGAFPRRAGVPRGRPKSRMGRPNQ